jgi:hypothetical protein
MSSTRRSRLPWALAAMLPTAACAPDDEPRRDIPPITWSGAHLDYAPQQGAYELCAGTLPYMDRYVALAATAMHVDLDEPLVYVHGSDEEASFCALEGVLGCAFRDSVYSFVAPQEHEIVHGVRSFAGFSHLFFEEGAAELFGDDTPMSLRVPANGDLREGIESANAPSRLASHWYPRAGHFAAYLHSQHGPEVTAELLRQTDPYSSSTRAIQALEAATGMPFADLRADYESEPTCDQPHFRYPLYACNDPAALRARCDGDSAVSFHERIACDDPTTLGPRDDEIWKHVAFEVPADGEYTFIAYTEEKATGARIEVKECSMRCDSIVFEKPMGIELPYQPVFLRAGRYAVRLTRPAEAPGSVSLKISGDDCT